MANHKSAKKRARQSIKKNLRNRSYLSMVKTAVKNFRLGLDNLKKGEGEASKVQELMTAAQSALQKAAAKGLLHKNRAARKVSRMAHELKTVNASAEQK